MRAPHGDVLLAARADRGERDELYVNAEPAQGGSYVRVSEEGVMEELISGLMAKVGIDRSTAERVAGYLKENAGRLPQMLGAGGAGDAARSMAEKAGLGGARK
jgi:hypothetical protein